MANKKRTKPYPPLFRGSAHLKQWQHCYEEWLKSAQEKSGSLDTLRSYRSEVTLFFKDPTRLPDTYTRNEVATFIRRPAYHVGGSTPPAPCTQNRRLATLKSFYEFASKYDVAYRDGVRPLLHKPDPTRGLHAIKPGRRRRGLSVEEVRRLFAVIPRDTIKGKRNYALLSCYLWTARRRCEILRLTWGDIYEVVFVEGGQPRVGHMYRFSTKGHSRDVFSAELPDEAWLALIDYLKASGRYESMRPDSPLFISTNYACGEEKNIGISRVNEILQEYADAAGLNTGGRKVTLHWLRHTRAQLQWQDDPSEKALTKIQKLLGHESISTTMIYLAGAEENPDDGAARLSAKLGKL